MRYRELCSHLKEGVLKEIKVLLQNCRFATPIFNTALQHCFELLQHCFNIATLFALKPVVANRPVKQHLNATKPCISQKGEKEYTPFVIRMAQQSYSSQNLARLILFKQNSFLK